MKFDLSEIEMSKSDIRRGIKLPEVLDERLAEFIGIMIGDGHLSYYPGFSTSGHKIIRVDVRIAAHADEQQYIDHIKSLFFSLFNTSLNCFPDTRSKTVILRINSKGIVQFLHKICEITLNRKTETAFIPKIIKNSDSRIKCSFLRGLADTDFSISFRNRIGKGHIYPVIKGGFMSRFLIQDLEILFTELGFRYCTCYDLKRYDKRFGTTSINCIYLNGKYNFNKWINEISSSNPKFLRKIEKWKADGECPPRY